MANTIREKELKTDWDSLTASDSTKAVGHVENLIPTEDSLIPEREKKGL
jgi:hypothetical protein